MGRFFDKNELVMIIFVILIFDICVSSGEFINYIFYKGKSGIVAYILIFVAVIMDIYVFYIVAESKDPIQITYGVNAENVSIDDYEKNKKLLQSISQKMSVFIMFVLLAIVITVLLMPGGVYSGMQTNTFRTRILRSVPLLGIVVFLFYYSFLSKPIGSPIHLDK
jgi:ABC-type multidrug transport system fused ATPase/permease subunit